MARELLLASMDLLEQIIRDVDITPTQFKNAERAYKSVGEWLNVDDSPLHPFSPEVFPQGSMRLGTVVKPRPEKDEFDVDLVCDLEGGTGLTRQMLREIVGDRLKDNKAYKDNVEPKHRCWRLNYADSAQFHLDIVPAIPDTATRMAPGEKVIGPNSILITDDRIPDWLHSNPKGYAEWFEGQMAMLLEEIRKSLKLASVKDIPYYERKTPLQKAIQVLKRHRDEKFGNNDKKPTSIIITTLAAQAYQGESDLFAALDTIVNHLEDNIRNEYGRAAVRNPANWQENFADKWAHDPVLVKNFWDWLGDAKQFVRSLSSYDRPQQLMEQFEKSFGARLTKSAAASAVPEVFKSVTSGTPTIAIGTSAPRPWGQ
ncbi:MAG TPA: nucleotidyltransferase [bacterium]|jgi:hypothetical protein